MPLMVTGTTAPAAVIGRGRDRAADGGAPRRLILGRQGRREAAAERRRIGEQGDGRVGAAQIVVVVGVGVEIEHRLGAAGGEAGELDERLVDDRRFALRAGARRGVEGIAERAEAAGGGIAARAIIGIDPDEGAQGAPGRLRPGVELGAAEGIEARRIARAGIRILANTRDEADPGGTPTPAKAACPITAPLP